MATRQSRNNSRSNRRRGHAGLEQVEHLEGRQLLAMTLTPAATALGLTLSTFASGLPNYGAGSVGPLGAAYGSSGSVLIADLYSSSVEVYPTEADGQSAASVTSVTYAAGVDGMATVGGHNYLATGGTIVRVHDDGTQDLSFTPISVPGALGVGADTKNGHLFVSGNSNIYDVDPVAGTASLFVSGSGTDGVTVAPDGKTVYGADNGDTIEGFDTTSKAKVFTTSISTVDGSAVGDGPFAGNIFGNTNDGRIVEVNLATGTQTLIGSGGSRGDFASVDPHNGTFLLSQTDSELRLSSNVAKPTIGSISPTSITAGTNPVTVTLNGSGFFSDSTLQFNGVDLPTTVVNSNQLMATIPASDLSTAGPVNLNVNNPGFGGGVSPVQSFTINPGPLAKFVVTGLTGGTAGTVEHATVQAEDALGNVVTSYAGTVHFTSSDPNAVLPADTTLTSGVGTFPVTLKKAGSDSVTVTDTAISTITGTESGIAVGRGAATHLAITGLTGGVAGAVEQATVQAQDLYGNVVPTYAGIVHFTSNDPQAILPADATLTAGTGTFPVTLKTAGSDSVTATDLSAGVPLVAGTQSGLVISPGAATHLAVTGLTGGVAGAVEQATVQAQDAYGNVVPTYAGIVHLTSNDPQAILPADALLIAGTGSFPVTLKTAGTDSVTATDTVTSTIAGTEGGVAINSGAATHLAVTGLTGGAAGTVEQATVQAQDAYGNVVPTYAGIVHFTSGDPQAILPADAPLTSGIGTFPVTLKTAGTDSVTATDTATSTIAGTEGGVAVSPGTATHLVVTGLTGGVAGAVEHATVQAQDAYGNIVPTYVGIVHFTSNDPQATLPANAPLIAGIGTFPVTLKTIGIESLTATDTATSTITGTEGGLAISPGVATHLVVSGLANGTAGGVDHATVQAEDAFGNVVPSYAGIVHFTSNDPQAILPADTTLIAGVGSFPVTFKAAGTASLTATDAVNPLIAGTEGGVAVSPGATTHLVVTGLAGGVAGTVEQATVLAQDAYGNVVPTYAGIVHFTSSDSLATLPADAPLTAGIGTFPVTLKTAGADSLTATDAATSTITGTDGGVAVSPAAATHLVVTGLAGGVAGTVEQATVLAQDAYGNVVPTYAGIVHFTSSDSLATLPADTTLVTGIGSFPVILKAAGTDSVTATDTVNPLITGTDGGVVVASSVATHLAVTGLTGGAAGIVEQATVQAQDAYGNVVPSYSGTVHFTSGDPNAALPADATLTAGVGTFPVTFKTAGSDSLTATDTASPTIAGTDGGLAISPSAATHLVVTGLTGGVAGVVEHATVQAQDAYGNVVPTYAGTVHFTSGDPNAVLPADTTLTSGVGTFPVTLKAAGTDSVTATDTSAVNPLIAGTDGGVAVSPSTVTHLVVGGLAGGTAGAVEQATVQAQDAYGNVVPTYAGIVHFTSGDPNAVLPADTPLVAGIGTFPVILKAAGSDSVTVTDKANPLIAGTKGGVGVGAAAATHLVVTGLTNGTAGVVEQAIVLAEDTYGNIVPSYAGTVHFTSGDPNAVLPPDATLASGFGTFPVILKAAGSDSVTATDTVNPLITGTDSTVLVKSAPATHLVVTGLTGGVAGTVEHATVQAQDAYGNIATSYSGTVRITSTDHGTLLPPTATLTSGVGTFAVTLGTAGGQSIVVTDPTTGGLAASNTSLAVVGNVRGLVYHDFNADGSPEPGEPGMAGRVVFLDLKHDGVLDAGDPTATTDANGAFSFPGIAVGSANVLEATAQDASSRYVVDQASANADGSLNIGVVPISPVAPVPVVPNPFSTSPAADANTAYVQSLYHAVMGRVGANFEVNTWLTKLSSGMTRQQVAAGFINSQEHRQDQVLAYYQDFLHRAPDPTSAHWVNALMTGMSEEKVAEAILDSPEYQAAHQDSTLYIQDLYIDVLGRQAGSKDLSYWQTALASGVSRGAVVAGFVESPEAVDQIVESFYEAFLHRQKEAGTSDPWMNMLEMPNASASDVAAGILSSPEFQQDSTKVKG